MTFRSTNQKFGHLITYGKGSRFGDGIWVFDLIEADKSNGQFVSLSSPVLKQRNFDGNNYEICGTKLNNIV